MSATRVKPTKVGHIQTSVRWAVKHGLNLTVIGGGHSDHCQRDNVVVIDMGEFGQIDILEPGDHDLEGSSDTLVVVGAGCKSGDIILKTMLARLTVPMGARPSVGAGLWLHGGIGHLARLHGLTCDAIVGAVVVSVASGEVLCLGQVPEQHRPEDASQAENEADLLWGLQGAGSNLCIVVSVTFKAYSAKRYSIHNWNIPLDDNDAAHGTLRNFDRLLASTLPRHCSSDAYLYWDLNKLHLGVSLYECYTVEPMYETLKQARAVLGQESNSKIVDGYGLFETEMYMTAMHGGHAGGKTSSFKRCVFLKNIGDSEMASMLVKAVQTRPAPQCYLHLLHGGGAVADVAGSATAFGGRDWDFACVITAVWSREEDNMPIARNAVQWVYDVVQDLLPLSQGAYAADLGPDPRDALLAAKAYGANLNRLARLKCTFDPNNVLAHACPLPSTPQEPKLIVLVTGEHGAGKDYWAGIWATVFATNNHTARVSSISDATKREYAAAHHADLNRLLTDREYKEQHRQALTKFYETQVQLRPHLPREHFLHVMYDAGPVDVLFITGMRDEAPVATFSHLVPRSRLLEVHVRATAAILKARRGYQDDEGGVAGEHLSNEAKDSRPSLIFTNDTTGSVEPQGFAEKSLLPFCANEVQQLSEMVLTIPNFPRHGIEFRDVLGISRQPGGLKLCTSLFRSQYTNDWSTVDAIVCCETGGLIFASALAWKSIYRWH